MNAFNQTMLAAGVWAVVAQLARAKDDLASLIVGLFACVASLSIIFAYVF